MDSTFVGSELCPPLNTLFTEFLFRKLLYLYNCTATWPFCIALCNAIPDKKFPGVNTDYYPWAGKFYTMNKRCISPNYNVKRSFKKSKIRKKNLEKKNLRVVQNIQHLFFPEANVFFHSCFIVVKCTILFNFQEDKDRNTMK